MVGANLTEAVLSQAHLRYAQLTGANLTSANLSGADLSMADLRANFSGALLEKADWIGRLAYTDPLTGLANRVTFERMLELEIARELRVEQPAARADDHVAAGGPERAGDRHREGGGVEEAIDARSCAIAASPSR